MKRLLGGHPQAPGGRYADEALAHLRLRPGALTPGDTVAWTITMTNSGAGTLRSWLLSDALDANTSLVDGSITTSGGNLAVGSASVSVGGGARQPGASVVVTLWSVVKAGLPLTVTAIANQASLSAANYATTLSDDPASDVLGDATVLTVMRASVTPSPTPTSGPTITPSPTTTAGGTPTLTATPTSTPTMTVTVTPVLSPTSTLTPLASATPSPTTTPVPAGSPSPTTTPAEMRDTLHLPLLQR